MDDATSGKNHEKNFNIYKNKKIYMATDFINPHYNEIKTSAKKIQYALRNGSEEEFINITLEYVKKYGLRNMKRNINDIESLRLLTSFYNESYIGNDIKYIQQHYRSMNNVFNYMFDYNDLGPDNIEDVIYTLKGHLKYIYNNNKTADIGTILHITHIYHLNTNFSARTAKTIYQNNTLPGGVIYDYSMGYGGRMVGAALSKCNYTYLGVDPNKNNEYGYNKLRDTIYKINPHAKIDFMIQGSEIYIPEWENKVDFAFSSPPYFNLEIYSDDISQAYNKYPEYKNFLEYYWRPTVKNIYKYLKPAGVMALNIKNKKENKYWDDFNNIIIEEGLNLRNKQTLKSSNMTYGSKNKNQNDEFISYYTKSPETKIYNRIPQTAALF